MVQSPASAIILAIAAIGVASSMALPFEQGADDLGVIKRIFDKDPNVRAVTNSEPQDPRSTPGSGTHSSGPSGHSSSPVAHSSGSVTLPSGHGPEIISTLHTSKNPGRTKTHYGSPDQTTTMHSIVTSAPHCHGMNSSTMGGGGGHENHSKHSPHPSSNPGAPPPSGSAKPTSLKPPMDRRVVTQSSSMPSAHSGHSVKPDAPSSAHASATNQSGGQEPHMTPTGGQTQATIVTGKHGGEPTGCPTAGGKPGNEGGHGGGHGEGSGHGKGDGGHKGSQDGSSSLPKPTEGGDNHGHQGTSSANAAPTQGGHGAPSSSGIPDPASVQTKGQRSMFRHEPSLDELD